MTLSCALKHNLPSLVMKKSDSISRDHPVVEEPHDLSSFNLSNATSNELLCSRGRLHKLVSSIKHNVGSQKQVDIVGGSGVSSVRRKANRKGSPTKMTSLAAKEFNSFMLSKRKFKLQRGQTSINCTEVTSEYQSPEPQSTCTSGLGENAISCPNELPCAEVSPGSQMQSPILLNVNSLGNAVQLPVAPSPPLTLSSGLQPTLLFLVGSNGMPVSGEASSLASVLDPSSPFANALFFAQPITLNVVPQETSAREGVIEKALELANVQANQTQSDDHQPVHSSTELTVSESTLITPNVSCILQPCASANPLSSEHSYSTPGGTSQTLVLAQSVASGENVPIDNVSQSVTVQTSQGLQNQGFSDLPSFVEESKSEITHPEMASSAETENFDECPKMIYRRKSILIRELMTQTGGDPEVEILGERKVDYGDIVSGVQIDGAHIQRSLKGPATPRVRKFGCGKCDKKFFTNNDLRRHQTSHQDARPFICEQCQKGFRTSSELTIHKAIHVQEKQYKCEFCGKEFRTKGCIKSHIKYHIGDRRHKCTECDRAFVKSADLKRHIAGHRNDKKFVCDDCGSAFTRRDNLKAHRLLHTRESVVTCDLCSKEFINAVYLKRHMHIHKQAKKKPYECQWCPKTYEQLEGLRRHIRQHVGDEKYVCKDCGKKFITSIQLKRHMWLSHDQDSPYRRSIL